ncbi:MAG: hypothetical protein QMD73_04850 [Rhodocyclaceae bacterium]|nr:hypothetical protein [Rhodocyclaceae bacterium]
MAIVEQLDKRPAIKHPACPNCKSDRVKLLKHWNTPAKPGFDPDYVCETCGFKWIHRRPGEKLRSFLES